MDVEKHSSTEDQPHITLQDLAKKIAQLPGEYQDLLAPEFTKFVKQMGSNQHYIADSKFEGDELRESEAFPRQREEHLRTLLAGILSSTTDRIVAVDDAFRYLAFNEAYFNECQTVYGADIQVGASLVDYLAPFPEDQARALDLFGRALRGESYSVTEAFGDPGRSRRYYELRFSPIRGNNGNIIGAAHISREVTERFRMEKTLRENESMLHALVSANAQVFYHMNPDWTEMRKLNGGNFLADTVEPDRNWMEMYIHPDDQAWVWEAIQKSIRAETFFDLEHRVLRADGTIGWMASRAVPVLNEDGDIAEWFGAASDITERKQAEEALIRSNQKISEILSSISDDFYVFDRDWKFVYANKQFAGKLGKTPEDLLGNSAWEMFPKHVGSILYENFHASMEKGETRRFEMSGQYTDAWYSVTSFPSAEGITILGSEITERIRAEEEIRKLLASVEQEKARLQGVINNIPDEVWFVDASGNLLLVNGQVLKAFGPGILVGQDVAHLSARNVAAAFEVYRPDGTVRPPDEAPPLRSLRGEYVQAQEEIVRSPVTGDLRYRQVNAAPVLGPDGAILGSVSVVRDITELRQLEKERVEAITQITVQRALMEQREKDRQAIARDLHDGPIQTLSSSLFQLHMVKEAFPDPSLQTELDLVGQDIKNTIHELRDLLNELRPPALIHFGLTKVIRMFVEDLKTRFPEIEVNVELAENDQLLSNDAHLTLFRIFQAGMNNIVRHSEASKVWVVFRLEADCYMLIVRDNGKGFDPKHDYSQLTRSGHFGLVGMKERAEVIGGELIVTSEPGNGTTISVKVPLSGKNLRLI